MISCDTNILFPACDATSVQHQAARAFLENYRNDDQFCLCEQVLMELYVLLRNPTVCRNPLSAPDATSVIQAFRSNPRWRIVDVVLDKSIPEMIWREAGQDGFAYRRIFDVRLAATLRHHGVTHFATRNGKDFAKLGFARVWDPFNISPMTP
jgi:toxin-antitoxin system PIN domain toxin